MLREELISNHPRLYHMAEAGSWPTIQEFGLMTTENIVHSSNLAREVMQEVLSNRRAQSINLPHPVLGTVVIRDQGPLNLANLDLGASGGTVEEWLHELNSRVFFWLHSAKLSQLLKARRYRNSEQDVITVDTRSLLEDYGSAVRLSPINSGATIYPNAPQRGPATFRTIEEYDYKARRRARGAVGAIVELAVDGGVPDIRNHVLDVRRMKADDVIEILGP
ncbi:DUF7002 family protein [Clavibacter michiganensis]|uniref:DUF7002 family protein n=1 Tax=Clavibacter michiganensis TaxID=28447 RepID=UPI003F540FAC